MKKNDKDRSHLRLIKVQRQVSEDENTVEVQHKIDSVSVRKRLSWRGLTVGEVLLPTLTLGFLIGVSLFLIYGLIITI